MGIMLVLKEKDGKAAFEEVETKANEIGYCDLRDAVGGYIEHVQYNADLIKSNIDMWVDDEGKIKGLSTTLVIIKGKEIIEQLVGPVVFTSNTGIGDTIGLTKSQIELIKQNIRMLTYNVKESEFCGTNATIEIATLPWKSM